MPRCISYIVVIILSDVPAPQHYPQPVFLYFLYALFFLHLSHFVINSKYYSLNSPTLKLVIEKDTTHPDCRPNDDVLSQGLCQNMSSWFKPPGSSHADTNWADLMKIADLTNFASDRFHCETTIGVNI